MSAGCITSGGARGAPSGAVVEFPSSQSMAELAGRPVAPPRIPGGAIPSDGWKLDPADAPVALGEPWQPHGPWEEAFAAAAAARRHDLRLTRAMSCVARELGRFLLRTSAPPPDTLRAFFLAACGAVAPEAAVEWLNGDVPAKVTDVEVLDHWRSQLDHDLAQHAGADATEGGFWFGRAHGKVVAVMTTARPMARLATRSPAPDERGDVLIEGELLGAAQYIVGYANRGRFGVEPCAIDPGIARPRFRAVCHLATGDATAWIQLLYAPPRRALAAPFVQLLVRRTPAEALTFDPPVPGEPRVVASADAFAAAIIERLNAVRAEAGMQPVRLAAAESASASTLAAHYFSAALDPAGGERVDRIALGLLAGWQVTDMIRDGRFLSSLTSHTRDARQWLASALMTPLGRAALLAPEIDEVALGPLLLSEPEGLAAVVTGYRLYHGDDHAADVLALHGRVAAARARLGLTAPRRLGGMDRVLASALERVKVGAMYPSQALNVAMQEGVRRFSANMRGYVIESTSIDALEIPAEVIKRPTLAMEIGVAHYKPPGAAWAQLVIFVIYADGDGPNGVPI